MNIQFNRRTGSRGIEWTDATSNPIGGCLHDCKWGMPDGSIAVCYAETTAETGVAAAAYPQGFKHHYWRPGELKGMAAGKEPRLIFIDSMSDLFAVNVPEEHIRLTLEAMHQAPHHTYQVLTKNAPRLLKFLDLFPPNLWVGISTPPDWFMGKELTRGQQRAMLKKGLAVLREVRERTGNIVWVSAEPLSWDVTPLLGEDHPLDFLVIGAASNGSLYYQPNPAHVLPLLTVMDRTNTPVFFKGNLQPLFQAHDFGSAALNRWREDFRTHYRSGAIILAVQRRQLQCRKYGWTENTYTRKGGEEEAA